MDTSHLTPQMQALLASREAQQLMHLLAQNGGSTIQQITQAIQRGDEAAAKELVTPLTKDPKVAALLKQLSDRGGV